MRRGGSKTVRANRNRRPSEMGRQSKRSNLDQRRGEAGSAGYKFRNLMSRSRHEIFYYNYYQNCSVF